MKALIRVSWCKLLRPLEQGEVEVYEYESEEKGKQVFDSLTGRKDNFIRDAELYYFADHGRYKLVENFKGRHCREE